MSRNNPNIEDPSGSGTQNPDIESPTGGGSGSHDPQPVPPGKEEPPVEIPPDQPGLPETDPDPQPIGDPVPNEPTRLV